MAKVNRSKWYKFVGDVYEHYEQDRSSKERTHTDNGWRLRSRKYGGTATFAKLPLTESLEQRPCPITEGKPGIYILRDSIFHRAFTLVKAKTLLIVFGSTVLNQMAQTNGTQVQALQKTLPNTENYVWKRA